MQESKRLKTFYLTILIIVKCNFGFTQIHSIYFIGDAGEHAIPGEALQKLEKEIKNDSLSLVVFIGDNCYPHGLPHLDIKETDTMPYLTPKAANFLSQLTILKKYKGNVLFLPGNHDWNAQKKRNGAKSVENERIIAEKYLNDSTEIKNKGDINYFTFQNSGGVFPYRVSLNEFTDLIAFDSQYFFQKIKGRKNKIRDKELKIFIDSLDGFMQESKIKNKQVIIASHHPIYTNGYHSKKRQPLRFLMNYTPFWLFGKLGLHRWLSQDIDDPFYKKYREKFFVLLKKYENVIWVAGHDHNLQLIKEGDDLHIVSGAGSKTKKMRKNFRFNSEFSNDTSSGFMKIELEKEKAHPKMSFYIDTKVITIDN